MPIQPVNSWKEAFKAYKKPRVIGMLFLGFSAGLPLLLATHTLSAWLRDVGIERTVIGFLSWVGITYSIKVFWAPIIDRLPLLYLTKRLGKRRSWLMLAQTGIIFSLVGLSLTDPTRHIESIAFFALLLAFSSATQDICIDAYRIEAMDVIYQGAMTTTYVLGYRIAILATGAGAFYIAEYSNWSLTYMAMALLMLIGLFTTIIIREPTVQPDQATIEREKHLETLLGVSQPQNSVQKLVAWFSDAVIAPFADFFQRNGKTALTILTFIAIYKLSDVTMGVMANPFYLDLGFSKIEIANVTKIFGFFMTIAGAALGGVMVIRYGIMKPLVLGAVMIATTNLLFAMLAITEPNINFLAIVISADNLSGGIATSVFIAYLSSLTNTAYTATQYALFSSLMSLPSHIAGGFSGLIVDTHGYFNFFIFAAILGTPAILLAIHLLRKQADNG